MKRTIRRHPSRSRAKLLTLSLAACLAAGFYFYSYPQSNNAAARSASIKQPTITAVKQNKTLPAAKPNEDYIKDALAGKLPNPFMAVVPQSPHKPSALPTPVSTKPQRPVLRGIITSGTQTVAIIEHGGSSDSYTKGDKIDDYTIGSLTETSVQLMNNDKNLLLHIDNI